MEVRVRFAPSPTGHLHIGGARTALFNWLFARKHGGLFILRIEDTDTERSSADMVGGILEGLNWLGLDWDEGPFYQSERIELYRSASLELLRRKQAYRCFCPEVAASSRGEYPDEKLSDPCRKLEDSEAESMGRRTPHALRFRTPENEVIRFKDRVFGQVEVNASNLEDFIILRSDGTPTYHLSVVADDIDMEVTHVIRGVDHLSNTAKHVLIFTALGRAVPEFAHLPLILGTDRKRLSKRHGATSVLDFRRQGFLPRAVNNYLVRLGWSSGDDQEFFSEKELVERFELDRVNKANAVFDPQKLEWMNGKYLSQAEPEELEPEVRRTLQEAGLWDASWVDRRRQWFLDTLDLLKKGFRKITDFSEIGRAFFSEDFEYDPEAVARYLQPGSAESREALRRALAEFMEACRNLEPFDLQQTERILRASAERNKLKAGNLIGAVRVFMTGKAHAPGIFEVLITLGRDRVVSRLERGLEELEGTRE